MCELFPPAAWISAASAVALSSEDEYVNATAAPSCDRRRTIAAPMPGEPPVAKAALPDNEFDILIPFYFGLVNLLLFMDGLRLFKDFILKLAWPCEQCHASYPAWHLREPQL